MPKPARIAVYVVAGAVGLVFVVALVVALLRPQSAPPVDWQSMVERSCHSAVSGHLKDPDSASYQGERIERVSDSEWTMTGTVHATNSFGGIVPTEFTCTAVKSSDESVSSSALLH